MLEYVTLNNGIKMPVLGCGVYQVKGEDHQPFNDYYGTYRAMEEAYKEGWLRAIGVSNFYPDRLVDLCSFAKVIPAVNPVLNEIGRKHGKSATQTALRFLIQSDVVVIPKSTHKERMIQNIEVFDFALDEQDMAAIRELDEKESLFFSHYDPATVERIAGRCR